MLFGEDFLFNVSGYNLFEFVGVKTMCRTRTSTLLVEGATDVIRELATWIRDNMGKDTPFHLPLQK
jgi:hypothetical protein